MKENNEMLKNLNIKNDYELDYLNHKQIIKKLAKRSKDFR